MITVQLELGMSPGQLILESLKLGSSLQFFVKGRSAPASPPTPQGHPTTVSFVCLHTAVWHTHKRSTARQPRYSRTGHGPSRRRDRTRPTGRLNAHALAKSQSCTFTTPPAPRAQPHLVVIVSRPTILTTCPCRITLSDAAEEAASRVG